MNSLTNTATGNKKRGRDADIVWGDNIIWGDVQVQS
jgi:hypothetical protein